LLPDAGCAGRRPPERFHLPVHAVGYQLQRAAALGAPHPGEDPDTARAGRCFDRPRAGWAAGERIDRPNRGLAAGGARAGHRQCPHRFLRPAADLDALYPAQPATQYRAFLKMYPQYQRDPTHFSRIYVSGAGNTQVPLSAVTNINRGLSPLVVNPQGQFPAITISFSLDENTPIEQATRLVDQA